MRLLFHSSLHRLVLVYGLVLLLAFGLVGAVSLWAFDRLLELQPREFRLLEYLMRHADQVVTRTMLLEAVWDYHFDPQTNVIDVHISKLRQKIDRDRDVALLHTVRGSGYLLGVRR